MTTLMAAVAVPALAFACTNSASLQSVASQGPALARTSVTVSGFDAAPVEVRWNSVTGPVLATLQGPRAAAGVTIPNDAPGVYYLYALQHDGSSVTKAVNSFEITGPGGTTVGDRDPGTSTSQLIPVNHEQGDAFSPVTAGLLALASGVLLMTAGVGIAELRRRRVRAGIASGEGS